MKDFHSVEFMPLHIQNNQDNLPVIELYPIHPNFTVEYLDLQVLKKKWKNFFLLIWSEKCILRKKDYGCALRTSAKWSPNPFWIMILCENTKIRQRSHLHQPCVDVGDLLAIPSTVNPLPIDPIDDSKTDYCPIDLLPDGWNDRFQTMF